MNEQELQTVQAEQEVTQAQEVQVDQTTAVEETVAAEQVAEQVVEMEEQVEEAAAKEEKPPKKSKRFPLYQKLFRLFTSKPARVIYVIVVFALTAFSMFLLDGYNSFRDEHMPWLKDNFFSDWLLSMNVDRLGFNVDAWAIFLTFAAVVSIFVIAGAIRKKTVYSAAKKNAIDKADERKRIARYTFFFYLVVVLLIAAGIFMAYMMGAYSQGKAFEQKPNGDWVEYDHIPLSVTLPNLVYTLLLCAAFILVIPVVLVLISFLLHAIIAIVAWFVALVKQFSADGEGTAGEEKKPEELHANATGAGAGAVGGGSLGVKIEDTVMVKDEPVPPAVLGKEIFPSLVRIDEAYPERETVSDNAEMSLEEFCLQFQAFAIKRKIYYELPMLRSFLAGMSAARLLILEGLSGTGKSMLPRMFCEFTGSKSFFAPVQATWRDKSDMLGYFSEFTKSFKSTDFLKNLYESSYTDRVNLMVLDEMNISRIEYYFADFLSILEYPPEDWKVRVFEPVLGQELPEKLDDGYVTIPENTWFIGTANTDDSTFTITDKVYDRAIVLDFAEKFSPITSNYTSDPIHIDEATLKGMFKAAQADSTKCLNKTDEEKFGKVCDFVAESFDLRFGNRIMVQINNFVPVYVALGGTKEEALDFMFARKILRKLNGAFEDYVKDKLIALLKLLNATYGKGAFKETEKSINKILKRLV